MGDGLCYLTLEGFAGLVGDDDPDLHGLWAILREIAARVGSGDDDKDLSTVQLAEELGAETEQAHRIAQLIQNTRDVWSSGMGGRNAEDFIFTPYPDAWYFAEVRSFGDYRVALERKDEDAHLISKSRGRGLWGNSQAFVDVPEPPWQKVPNGLADLISQPDLRRVVAADIDELNRAQEARAWKAVAFLAGSCCEAVLLEILHHCDPDEVQGFLGKGWETRKGIEALGSVAKRLNVISDHSFDVVGVVKKWRDLIHPWRAARRDHPTAEVARTLVALLELLFSELRTHAEDNR
jgi:hypothetical protein